MVDSAPDSKEFHFSRINIGCMMSHLAMISCPLQVWEIMVAILFLILVSAIIGTMSCSIRESLCMLSNLFYFTVNNLGSF